MSPIFAQEPLLIRLRLCPLEFKAKKIITNSKNFKRNISYRGIYFLGFIDIFSK